MFTLTNIHDNNYSYYVKLMNIYNYYKLDISFCICVMWPPLCIWQAIEYLIQTNEHRVIICIVTLYEALREHYQGW